MVGLPEGTKSQCSELFLEEWLVSEVCNSNSQNCYRGTGKWGPVQVPPPLEHQQGLWWHVLLTTDTETESYNVLVNMTHGI